MRESATCRKVALALRLDRKAVGELYADAASMGSALGKARADQRARTDTRKDPNHSEQYARVVGGGAPSLHSLPPAAGGAGVAPPTEEELGRRPDLLRRAGWVQASSRENYGAAAER